MPGLRARGFIRQSPCFPPLSKRSALFEAPPAMLAQAWPWVSGIHAGMCLARLPEKDALVDLRDRLTAVSGGQPQVSAAVREFPIDLSGWRYGEAEVPANWATYRLVLSPKGGKNQGWWSGRTHVVVIYLGKSLNPKSVDGFREFQEDVRDTLAHELTHLAQGLMRAMRVTRGVLPGLPSRRRRREKAYDIMGRPLGWSRLPSTERESWMEEYPLREVEFQPLLKDEVAAFRRAAPKVEKKHRRALLRAWLLPLEHSEPKEHPLPKWWWHIVALTEGHGFFDSLYHGDREKWRDAAGKFVRSVADLL